MRPEYEVYQLLAWDANFRRLVATGDFEALRRRVPGDYDLSDIRRLANSAGLAEEAYRRLASLYKVSSEIFLHAHNLLIARLGSVFFEDVLASYFSDLCASSQYEILELFDGYVAGPRIKALAAETAEPWLVALVDYEWAVWHAGRVAQGWPPVRHLPPLVPGATLVSADFDLESLLREIKRLKRSSVSSEVFVDRIVPSPGIYRAVVLPKDGSVAIAKLDEKSYSELVASTVVGAEALSSDLRCSVEDFGIVIANSFLCCSNEMRETVPTRVDVAVLDPH